MAHAEEAPPYNQPRESKRQHTLFTDSSCLIVETSQKWKAAILEPKQQVTESTKGQDGSSQNAELKPNCLWILLIERSGQHYTSILTCRW